MTVVAFAFQYGWTRRAQIALDEERTKKLESGDGSQQGISFEAYLNCSV